LFANLKFEVQKEIRSCSRNKQEFNGMLEGDFETIKGVF
jgi:hypothetical protein